MKLTLNWLSDYLDTSRLPSAKEYCDRMTDTGSKVEGFEVAGADIENVVVGKILKIEKHPDSDHLLICQIDIGTGENVQIVTGAQNIFEGALVPVACPVAHLPGDVVIKAGKLRGVPSNGMLCSVGELGLDAHDVPYAAEDGILILQEDCKPGDDIHDVLMLSDTVVEFEITSNRPDCFSVIGLAKETGVSFEIPVAIPTPEVKKADKSDNVNNYLSVDVLDGTLCPRYSARVIKDVKIGPSPMWLRTRLRMVGIRPINNIVDITNYVMTEYGQPMHAFDKSFLEDGKIVVRRAAEGEKITTLDSVERTLTEKMLVICDGKKPVAVAGVMGGENSEINENTTTVVFESANFLGTSVRTTARDLGMRTESSGRYEKGLDAENTIPALERACELVELLGCGTVVDGVIDVYSTKAPERRIPFSAEKINALLGTEISSEAMLDIFNRLSFKYDGENIIPPTWRPDIEKMADLAEEVARIYGYNNIESHQFSVSARVGRYTPRQHFEEEIKRSCFALNLTQIETYSFISPKIYDALRFGSDDKHRDCIVISNPLGEDTSVMRTTGIGNLLGVLARNRGVRNQNVGVFELAKCYFKEEGNDLADERVLLNLGFYERGDFYLLKGYVEAILDEYEPRIKKPIKNYSFTPSSHPSFHPGRSADVIKDGKVIGTLGQIHPDVAKSFGIDTEVYAAELDLELIFELREVEREYRPLSKFPATTRDLAFVCDKSLDIATAEKTIAKYAGAKLEKISLFDVYVSDALGQDKKSLAFNLTLRDEAKTLTVEETDKICAKIIRGMEFDLGAKLR
jgi:phenylalanyl-tRNA synthetase beta chain